MASMSLGHDCSSRNSKTTYALMGAVLALAAGSAYAYFGIRALRHEQARLQGLLVEQVSTLRDSVSARSTLDRQHLDALALELDATRKQAIFDARKARLEAQLHAEDLAARVEQGQLERERQLEGELNSARAVAVAAGIRAGLVGADVGGVKTGMASNRSGVNGTAAGVGKAEGDLATLQGLVAANAAQLAALRARGDRRYFQFELTRSGRPQTIGGIGVRLKKADARRNRYTVELTVGNKIIEKKDRNTNEPVLFYLSQVRQPYELVVNEVGKGRISGYLAAPR